MSMKTIVRTVLIDLSGTLHIDNNVINGSIDALKRLRNSQVKIKFVTNTTKESQMVLFKRLISLGFELEKNEIFTSLHAARNLLKKQNLKPKLLIESAAWDDFEDFKNIKEEDMNAVVIGLAPSAFNYDELNKSFRMIMNGAQLIAIHQARYFKQPDGLSLGPGPFVKGLEYATDVKATVVGKPNKSFFIEALDGEDPNFTVMIGDDVRDDIAGAQELGIKGLLVKTGKYRSGDEQKISPPPFRICQNFKEAVDIVLEMNENEIP